MSPELALRVSNVSKCYRLYAQPQDRLKQFFLGRWKRCYQEFWALKETSFEVPKGSSLGIIGRNGAGKSTLLQLLVGTLAPTTGTIERSGRISALLELGTGFNPEFSGHENIFLNASILGLTKQEIEDRYDEIIDFADIGEFIRQPVKTYSSGMFVRLAFAVAITVDPDIFVVDEALSVGDIKFQAKCFRKFEEFREKGKTILFVTHSSDQIIRHCDHALLIDGGRVINSGPPKAVVHEYLNLMFGNSAVPASKMEEQHEVLPELISSPLEFVEDRVPQKAGYNKAEFRWGSREAEIVDITLSSDKHSDVNHFDSHSRFTLEMTVKFNSDAAKPIYGMMIKTSDGMIVYSTNSRDFSAASQYIPRKAGSVAVIRFSGTLNLFSQNFLLSIGVVNEEENGDLTVLDRRYDVIEILVKNLSKSSGICDLQMTVQQSGIRFEQPRVAVNAKD